ncbi:hypothetical protein BDV10DRAFT_160806 [Aspergillus recurvatus]
MQIEWTVPRCGLEDRHLPKGSKGQPACNRCLCDTILITALPAAISSALFVPAIWSVGIRHTLP